MTIGQRHSVTAADDQAAITIDGLTKRYGATLAVDELSFEVRAGQVTGFLGPNGAGKTTTLRTVLGLVRPTDGRALVEGERFDRLRDPARTVGAALETGAFHPGRSGRAHLRAVAAAARLPDARVDEVLELVELASVARRRVKTYSLGMRQRLALATALLGDPRTLVLDEPANGLDPQGVRWLRDVLREQAARGRAVLVSSHLLAEVAQTVDHLVVIDRGRLVTEAPLAEVMAGREGAVRVRSPEASRLAGLLGDRGGVTVESAGDDLLLVRGAEAEDIGLLAAEHGIALFELTRQQTTLEERFFELTGEGGHVR
jgi:ABC-2 type transport system ATP-binding protein